MIGHFLLHEESKLAWGPGMIAETKRANFRVQPDRSTAAGRLSSASVPGGTIELHLCGAEAQEFFQLGRLYKVEFTPLEEEVATQEQPKLAVVERETEDEGAPEPELSGEAA